ncbi:Predicted arabinose efflux permease, MFS family [Raineyella antarctica]|uniref:Predicted arabinose efflux permease, MFS family n=2 Tax=Raineyella antarctica TaxID=1577474 RepID=A0A1G6GSC1_9ACTN|nr:Predicted arabinose efflux permease, MFS family [Raineyella antarctica]
MFCAGVATFAQLYAPQAVLPAISAGLSVPPAQAALLVSAATGGLAMSVLWWSWLADRWGRVRTMLLAIIVATLAGAAFTFVASFPVMVALRFVEGAGLGGVAGVAVAYITEETHAASMAAATGLYISGTSLGGLSGRLLSGPLTDLTGSWRVGVGSVIALSAVAGVLFAVLVPPPRRFTPRRTSLVQVSRLALAHLRNPGMRTVFVQAFCLMGAFVTIYNYLGFRLERPPFALSPTVTSLLFLSYLAGTWSSSRATRSAVRFGRRTVLLGAGTLMLTGLALTWVVDVAVIIVGLVVLTAGFFAGHAIASALAGIMAEEGRAQATALYNFFYYAGSSVLGWVGGYLFSAGGWTAVSMFCAIVVAVAMLVAWSGLRPSVARTP